MGNYKIIPYSPEYSFSWNSFISSSKNSTFLFHRDFIEYHKARFEDYSLMVFKDNKLVAVLPANLEKDVLYSHKGLSYGGLILPPAIKFKDVNAILFHLLKYLNTANIKELILKEIPKIYTMEFTDEMSYLHFILKSQLIRRDSLSAIDMRSNYSISKNRVEGLKRGQKNGLKLLEVDDFDAFWNLILIPNLKTKHNASPVHNLDEITYLKSKFPKNIRQFNVYDGDTIVAGTTIFESDHVAHAQYISGSTRNNELGSLDFLYIKLLKEVFNKKAIFDFGSSNETMGLQINKGLQFWKEGFGARTITQDFYKVSTENYSLLESLFI